MAEAHLQDSRSLEVLTHSYVLLFGDEGILQGSKPTGQLWVRHDRAPKEIMT